VRRSTSAALVLGTVVCVAACESSAPTPGPTVTLDAPAERNAPAVVSLTDAGRTLGPLTIAALEGQADITGDTVRPRATGRLVLRLSAGAVTRDTALLVAAPPTIVFGQPAGANWDIWAAALDGFERRALTDVPADDRFPTVAGGRVVFVSNRNATRALWSAPVVAPGAAAGTATAIPGTTNAETPALSSDNRRLAWVAAPASVPLVFTADAATGNGTRFAPASVSGEPWAESAPQWSPTGDLWFVSGRGGLTFAIWRGAPTGAIGSAVVALAAPADSVRLQPAFSPDGRWLAYTTDRLGGRGTALVVAPLAGGAPLPLADGWRRAAYPRWVDDRRVVFEGRYLRGVGDTAQSLLLADRLRPGRITVVPGTDLASYPAVVR
jgi:hypothetical protein